jgi:transketolase
MTGLSAGAPWTAEAVAIPRAVTEAWPAVRSLSRKVPLNRQAHTAALQDLNLAAVAMRRKILYLGYHNRITLHYGALLGMAEMMTLLYLHWLRVEPGNPGWAERDRFVLSKGHGAPAWYVALSMAGFFSDTHFDGFRRLNSILQGHPDRLKTPGVEASSGSLGQGIGVACGMALAAKVQGASWRAYALVGDGECNEGSVWEAAQIAANLRLDRITVLLDRNGKSSYGPMAGRNDVAPLADKWRAFGWAVSECDGHDFVALSEALSWSEAVEDRPAVVICHTIKGKGLPYTETVNTKAHILISDEDYAACLKHLDGVEKEIRDGIPL